VVPGLLVLGAALLAASGASGRTAAAPTVSTEPSISGAPVQGNTLTGDKGTWNGTAPITFTGVWVRCDTKAANCTPISGATSTKYKLVGADVGSRIRFRVTAKNADGSKTADSNATDVVETASGEPANVTPPVIAGFAQVGTNLQASTGTWVGATPISYSYQWQRCDTAGNACKSISGADNASYTVVGTDVGHTLRVKVTAHNSKGNSSAISAQTVPVTNTGGGGGAVVQAKDIPATERLVVDTVVFSPNPVTSRSVPIEVRVKVKDTRGKLVQGALVFVRSTPVVTSTPAEQATGADGWVTYTVHPESDFPIKNSYSVQFYVKASRAGDPTLAGIYGSRLVQVKTHTP
jgi:hypothetical protein